MSDRSKFLALPSGAPAPPIDICWKVDNAPGSLHPMEHCTFVRRHTGPCTWARCLAVAKHVPVDVRCVRETGHVGVRHRYGRLAWAEGYGPGGRS